jgi:hypothetical protein
MTPPSLPADAGVRPAKPSGKRRLQLGGNSRRPRDHRRAGRHGHPAVNKALKAGHEGKSLSNLHHVAAMVTSYVADSGGFYPPDTTE